MNKIEDVPDPSPALAAAVPQNKVIKKFKILRAIRLLKILKVVIAMDFNIPLIEHQNSLQNCTIYYACLIFNEISLSSSLDKLSFSLEKFMSFISFIGIRWM